VLADPEWNGLKIGDWATWIAAASSAVAVITALVLSKSDSRRRDREQTAHGRVIASFLYIEVGLMNARLAEAISQAQACLEYSDEKAMHSVDRIRTLIDAIDTTKFTSNLDKLAVLPVPHGEFLASVADIKRVIVSTCEWKTRLPFPNDAHSVARDLLPQLLVMKKSSDAFLNTFKRKFTD
jgi:hypothetical protein